MRRLTGRTLAERLDLRDVNGRRLPHTQSHKPSRFSAGESLLPALMVDDAARLERIQEAQRLLRVTAIIAKSVSDKNRHIDI